MHDELKDIEEDILFMEKRYVQGQGDLSSAMCRLTLPKAKWLIDEVKRLRVLLEIQTASLMSDKVFLIGQRDRALKELQILTPTEKWAEIRRHIMGDSGAVARGTEDA